MTKKISIYPSLSSLNWVRDSKAILDSVMSSVILANYSQAYVFSGSITSMPKMISDGTNDIPRTIRILEEGFTNILGRYYNSVAVEVTDITSDNSSIRTLSIFIEVIDNDNKKINLKGIFTVEDGKFKRINDILNT